MLWTVHIKTSSRTSPGLRTYGVAERALERREDSFIHDSLAIARPVDPRVVSIPGGWQFRHTQGRKPLPAPAYSAAQSPYRAALAATLLT